VVNNPHLQEAQPDVKDKEKKCYELTIWHSALQKPMMVQKKLEVIN
jgi:hypothetical protein